MDLHSKVLAYPSNWHEQTKVHFGWNIMQTKLHSISLPSKWKQRFHSKFLQCLYHLYPPLVYTSIQPTNQILKQGEQEWLQNMEGDRYKHQVSTDQELIFLKSLTLQLKMRGSEKGQHWSTTYCTLREYLGAASSYPIDLVIIIIKERMQRIDS